MRFHLFPFRTEKLSSLTPMVLRFSRGRVGSRLFKSDLRYQVWLFLYLYKSDLIISSLDLKRRQCRTRCVTHPLNPPPWLRLPPCGSAKCKRVCPLLSLRIVGPVRGTLFICFVQNLLHSIQKLRGVRVYPLTDWGAANWSRGFITRQVKLTSFVVIAGYLWHIPYIPEWEIRRVCPIRVYFTMHHTYPTLTTKRSLSNTLRQRTETKKEQ